MVWRNVLKPKWLLVIGVLLVVVCSVGFGVQIGEQFQVSEAKQTQLPQQEKAIIAEENAQPPLHQHIITTVFWAGEGSSEANGGITNSSSAWVDDWTAEFGGVDDPTNRNGYLPAGFTPHQNAFYAALPYNDYTGDDQRKTGAERCLTATGNARGGYSWCKNAWLKITIGNRTAYAQWEDVGPFGEADEAYVFGGAQPQNTTGERAGLDISPATRDYLIPGATGSSEGTYRTTWQFVPASAVPAGPWKQTITTTPGRPVN